MAREQKTPTKVASVFVDHNFSAENNLMDLSTRIFSVVNNRVQKAKDKLSVIKPGILKSAQSEIKQERTRLNALKTNAFRSADNNIRLGIKRLNDMGSSIFKMADSRVKFANINMAMHKQTVKMSDPQNVLNRGFAIVKSMRIQQVITNPDVLDDNSELEITLKEGTVLALVHNTELTNKINAIRRNLVKTETAHFAHHHCKNNNQ
jgi:exonuclease VII large subunit